MSKNITLFCLAIGVDLVPQGDILPVKSNPHEYIYELKESIMAASSLRDIPIANVILWKLDDSFQLEVSSPFEKIISKLRQLHIRLESRTESQNKVHILSIAASVGEAFSSPLGQGCVHILVQSLQNNIRKPPGLCSDICVKRRKLHNDIPPFLLGYHHGFWGVPLDNALTTLPTTQLHGDLLPGEPFLTFRKPILVRAEYIRAFDAVKAEYERSGGKRLIRLTGQPGIGKTFWIDYTLRRCLGEKQPVVWYYQEIFFLFSDAGVSIIDPMFHETNGEHTWCFVDSFDAPTLPASIGHEETNLFPIHVTPPEGRLRHHSRRIPSVIVMNPWTIEEMMKIQTLYPDRTPEEVRERFYNAGPVPRYCLGFTPQDIRYFYRRRETAIAKLNTIGSFTTLIDNAILLNMNLDSEILYLISRASSTAADTHVIHPITLPVSHQLCNQLLDLEDGELNQLLRWYSRTPAARGLMGIIFKAKFMRSFHLHIHLHAKPLILQSSESRSIGEWTMTSLQPQRQQASSDVILNIQPKHTVTFAEYDELNGITDDVYFIPQSPYAMALDGLIVHSGHLYLFQFATDTCPNVDPRLDSILGEISGLPSRHDWVFIFLVPEDLPELTCPHSDDGVLKDHTPFIAHLPQKIFLPPDHWYTSSPESHLD